MTKKDERLKEVDAVKIDKEKGRVYALGWRITSKFFSKRIEYHYIVCSYDTGDIFEDKIVGSEWKYFDENYKWYKENQQESLDETLKDVPKELLEKLFDSAKEFFKLRRRLEKILEEKEIFIRGISATNGNLHIESGYSVEADIKIIEGGEQER